MAENENVSRGSKARRSRLPRDADGVVALCFFVCLTEMQTLASLCVVAFDVSLLVWRTAAALMGIVTLGAAAYAIRTSPRLLTRPSWSIVGQAAGVAGFSGALTGLLAQIPILVVAGFAAGAFSAAWAFMQTSLAGADLPRERRFSSLAAGFVGSIVASVVISLWVNPPLCLVACACGTPVVSFTLRGRVKKPLQIVSADDPGDLAVANPSSFLPFSNKLFGMILLFACLSGYSCVAWSLLSPTASRTMPVAALVATLAVCFLVMATTRRKPDVDDLFYAALLPTVVGFIFQAMTAPGGLSEVIGPGALAVMLAGSNFFMLFVWLLFFELSSRNIYAAPSLALFGVAAFVVGACADSLIWLTALEFESLGMYWDNLINVPFLCFFVVYVIVFLRGYSFEGVISGIRPVELVAVVGEEASWDEVCASMAERFALTPRERDVFVLLARGRNSRFIEEALVVSKNTVKTHTRNLYRKLDVHSQQQLIDAVEKERLEK